MENDSPTSLAGRNEAHTNVTGDKAAKTKVVKYAENVLGLNPYDPTKVVATRIERVRGVHALGRIANQLNVDSHGNPREVAWVWVNVFERLRVRYWSTVGRGSTG